MTPGQILKNCLIEAGDDTNAGLEAAEYIFKNSLDVALAVETDLEQVPISAFFANDIANKQAQGILNESLKAAKELTASARRDLASALKKSETDNGVAILNFINKYQAQLSELLTQIQIDSVLEGAKEVASKVPTLENDASKLGGIPTPTFPDNIPKGTKGIAQLLASKNVLTRQQYDALDAQARAKAFTVAGVDAQETLTKIRDTLAENVKEGADYATFKQKVLSAVDEGTFLSESHLETVFRANVQGAFSDGQMSVLSNPLVQSEFPYSAYDSIHDDRARHEHNELDVLGISGTNIYRNDDPVFQTFRPPWAYGCRCSWTPLTIKQAARQGIKEAQEWQRTGIPPVEPTFVPMPPFSPPEGFQRAVTSAPLSIRLSLQPLSTFAPKKQESVSLSIECTEDTYPRNKANQFLDKHSIANAANDIVELEKLRESLNEDQRWKLDKVISYVQSGGLLHHPKENPGFAINIHGEIENPQWAEYQQAITLRSEWEKYNTKHTEYSNYLKKATKLLRKDKFDLDEVDELLKSSGATDKEMRTLSRARHRMDFRSGEMKELEDTYDDVVEEIYKRMEEETKNNPEPVIPIPPDSEQITTLVSPMFSYDVVNQPSIDEDNEYTLANFYAPLLSALAEAGANTSTLFDDANEELEGTGWTITQQGNQFLVSDTSEDEEDAEFSNSALFSTHYEIGQVWKGNNNRWFTKKMYKGRARVVPAKNPNAQRGRTKERVAERKTTKPTNREGLERRLAPHGKNQPIGYQQFHKGNTKRIASAIKRYHGEAAIERIEELTELVEGALNTIQGDTWQANRARRIANNRLRELQAALQHIVNPEVELPKATLKPKIVIARPEQTQPANIEVVPESLRKYLVSPDGSDHQLQGAAKAIEAIDKVGGFLLADGAGAGKTRQMLAIAKTYAMRGKKAVFVAPAGIIKPDWKGGSISGSVGKDGEAMGVTLQLNKGDKEIKSGEVHVTTYEQLAAMKERIDDNTVVIFDESHGLKNAESNRSIHGKDVAAKAMGVVYGTATPADSAMDLAYLFRTKLFGDEPWNEVKKRFNPDKVGAAEALYNTSDLFDKLTDAGIMVKREISLDGVEAKFDTIKLSAEDKQSLENLKLGTTTKDRAQVLMRQRFAQEKLKIPHAVSAVNEELKEGRRVVIFVAGVGSSDEGELGTAGQLREALATSGVDMASIGELHGGDAGGGKEVVEAFQSGAVKVMITTAQSGGTGHNLDDVRGDAPRTQIILTAPFSAIDNAQIWGRTHRLTTRSKSRMRYIFANTDVDRWNADLIRGKVMSLGAIVAGETMRQDIPGLNQTES